METMREFFHDVATAEKAAKQNANFVQLIGDGTPILRAPGLKKINRIIVSGAELPAINKVRAPKDLAFSEYEETDVPNYAIRHDETGTPVVLRSILSNDGIWQDGAVVLIDGEWEKPKAKADPAKAGA